MQFKYLLWDKEDPKIENTPSSCDKLKNFQLWTKSEEKK